MLTHVHKVVHLVVGTFEQEWRSWSEGGGFHCKTVTGHRSRSDLMWWCRVQSFIKWGGALGLCLRGDWTLAHCCDRAHWWASLVVLMYDDVVTFWRAERRKCETERWPRQVTVDRTRQVMVECLRILSGSDRTRGRGRQQRVRSRHVGRQGTRERTQWRSVRSWPAGSGRYLIVGAENFDRWDRADNIEPRGYMARIVRPDAGWRASGRPDWCVWLLRSVLPVVPNGSISWELLFKPHGRLKLTLLAICINIATLWA
jgi:hypothetical protein